MKRKIRMGMVGGGRGAFIGGVHRMAAALDGEIELVCGAFSSNPEKSRLSGEDFYLNPDRVYASYPEMIEKEASLPLGERMDFVSIVTPNHVHFGPAKMAMEYGFHVVCDKPLCIDMDEALELQKMVRETGLIFAVTHNYTGYPMVKQAKAMVANGELGEIRKVVVEYPQGWLAAMAQDSDQFQAAWRTDPSKSGLGGALGDIGSHAENLVEYITGLKIVELCADVSIILPEGRLDDDANLLLHFDNGARGILYASQISIGEENNLSIRIYGEKAGLEWRQEEPNSLKVRWIDKPMEIVRTGYGELYSSTQAATRIPAGHPEGFLEAFANIYKNVARSIHQRLKGEEVDNSLYDFPTIDDGVRGMKFIQKAVESGFSDSKWVKL